MPETSTQETKFNLPDMSSYFVVAGVYYIEITKLVDLNVGGHSVEIDPTEILAEKAESTGDEGWLDARVYLNRVDTDGDGHWSLMFTISNVQDGGEKSATIVWALDFKEKGMEKARWPMKRKV